jgi:hypothetical protein
MFIKHSLIGSAVFAVLISSSIASSVANAYFSTLDTGDIIEKDKYQVMLEPQVILTDIQGVNAVTRFDTGIDQDSSLRAILGFGKVDFQIGGMYKYVPFPDTAKQPAIGGEAGILFARVNGGTEFSLRLHPLVSKTLETEIGDVIPYGSIPFGFTSKKNEDVFPIQLVGGSELRPLNTPGFSFFGELGVNVNKAFSYVSVAVAYRFDDKMVRKHK